MDQGPARALILAAALALGCATAGGEGSGGSPTTSASSQVGAPLPALEVEAMSGKKIDLGAYRGKVLLLDVWASWCGPCKQELPVLNQLAGKLKSRGVEILAVSIDQDRANVLKFLRGYGKWSLTIAHDPAGSIAERLQPDKMPTSYIIDRAGIVRYVNAGFVPEDAPLLERRLLEVAAN
jgi:DsbE subfamily thiol:disulfide oxidoreductase